MNSAETHPRRSVHKPKRLHGVGSNRIVTPQPDRDIEALKACCHALESCSCREMIQAILDFLNSKYGPPGALRVSDRRPGSPDAEQT